MMSKELNALLIETFPNLKASYIEEVGWQDGDDTGSHIVYGDVFTPYVVHCTETNNKKELQKIFLYLEFLLLKRDLYTDEVVAFSVLESMEGLLKGNEEIHVLAGERTMEIIKEL